MNALFQAIAGLIYPQRCVHCEERLDLPHLFCPFCQEHLTLIDPIEASLFNPKKLACFESMGPAASFKKVIIKLQTKALIDLCASLLLFQLQRLETHSFAYLFSVEDSLSYRLAKQLASLLSIPLLLEVEKGDFTDKKVLLLGFDFEKNSLWQEREKALFWGFPESIFSLALFKSQTA